MKSAADKRKDARKNWPVNAVSSTLDDEISLARATTSAERLAMMWQISHDAWVLTGKGFPDYQRHNMPGKLVTSDEL